MGIIIMLFVFLFETLLSMGMMSYRCFVSSCLRIIMSLDFWRGTVRTGTDSGPVGQLAGWAGLRGRPKGRQGPLSLSLSLSLPTCLEG